MKENKDFEVIIIGGSYAGLSAAMSLGRSLRKVLVIDSGLPCNRQTPHSHNFLTLDGEVPKVIAEKARAQVMKYSTIKFLDGQAERGEKTENGFAITTQAGELFTTRKLVFASGIRDIMPAIKGFAACWGISVVHCPYCHGYELRRQKTGLLANGKKAIHLGSLINNLTEDLTILTTGKADFDSEEMAKLHHHKINIIETDVSEIIHENGYMKSVIFSNGEKADFDAVYAALPFEQNSTIPVELGCALTEQGFLTVDSFQKTTVDGVFACGDNTVAMRSIANAVYGGNLAGAMVNKELTDDQF